LINLPSLFEDLSKKVIQSSLDRYPHPTLLAVNREARHETLKAYKVVRWDTGMIFAFDNSKDMVVDDSRDCGELAYDPWGMDVKRIAVQENSLLKWRSEDRWEAWVDAQEIFVVLTPGSGVYWYQTAELVGEERVLEPGVQIEECEGWGNMMGLSLFMEALESARRRLVPECGPVRDENGRLNVPVVKVVQWSWSQRSCDPFCVSLTPLSLK
jgi:hypothetical protein